MIGNYGRQNNDAGKWDRRFALRQLRRIDDLVYDSIVSLELVERARSRRVVQRNSFLSLKLCEPLSPFRHWFAVSNPDFSEFWIVFVAEAKGENLITAIKKIVRLVVFWRLCIVSFDELRKRVTAAQLVIRHDASVA